MRKHYRMLLLLMFALIFSLLGCGKEEQEGTQVDLFFLNNGETRLISEKHILTSTEVDDKAREVLTILSEKPDSKDARPVISGGINVINVSYKGSQITLSLGEKYKEQKKATEVLTRAAIVKSLTQIEGVDVVLITINGKPIQDASGKEIGLLSADSFVDNPGEQMDSYEKVTIKLYFTNENGDKLIPVNRELVHNINTSNTSMEKLIIEQLISGPVNNNYYPTINPATKLLGVTVKDGTCYVNLDSSALFPANVESSEITIYSITNSLVELNNINKVQISIEGKSDIIFRDKYNLTTIFERNLDFVE